MFEYILRLLILLPIVGGMAWGSLWLWKRVQMGVPLTGGQKQGRPIEWSASCRSAPERSWRWSSSRDSRYCCRCHGAA